MGNWSVQQEAKKEVKEKDKVRQVKNLLDSFLTWRNSHLRVWFLVE